MSKKHRVFQVARELKISNEAVIDFFGKKDKSIRNQMSAVSEELYTEICQEYSKETVTSSDSGQDFRQQIKEKHALEEMRRNKARIELEERLKFATQLAEERPQRLKKAEKLEKELAELKKEEGKKAAEEASKVESQKAKAKKEEIIPEEKTTAEEFSVVEMISKAKKEIEKEQKALEEDQADSENKKPVEKKTTKAKSVEKSKEEKVVETKDGKSPEQGDVDKNALAKKLNA